MHERPAAIVMVCQYVLLCIQLNPQVEELCVLSTSTQYYVTQPDRTLWFLHYIVLSFMCRSC